VFYKFESGILRKYWDTTDKQSVENAQGSVSKKAQDATSKLQSEQGRPTKAFKIWQK